MTNSLNYAEQDKIYLNYATADSLRLDMHYDIVDDLLSSPYLSHLMNWNGLINLVALRQLAG